MGHCHSIDHSGDRSDPSGLFDFAPERARPADLFEDLVDVGGDSYHCELLPNRPLLALANPVRPLLTPGVFAAPPVKKSTLPPPPKNPIARVLYDLTTQLNDFEMTINIDIPIEGMGADKRVDAMVKSILKDKGAVILLDAQFKPGLDFHLSSGWGIPVVKQVVEYFTGYRVLRVFMDPKSRKIKGRIDYRNTYFSRDPDRFPFVDVHKRVVEKGKLSPQTVKKYNLQNGLPVYSWEIVDLFFTALDERRKQQKPQTTEFEKIRPLWDKGEISIEGNFSNQTVTLPGLKIKFAELPKNEKHRITVKGKLLEPVITIQGLESLEVNTDKADFRLVNAQPNKEPLKIIAKFDPDGKTPLRFTIPHYQSDKVFLETEPKGDPDMKLRFDLQEGIEIQDLTFWFDKDDPRMDIKKLVAKQIAFDGFGLHLETTPGDSAVFTNVHVHRKKGEVYFNSEIEGKGNGEISYRKNDQEIGAIKFQYLEGKGKLSVGPDAEGVQHAEISGNVTAELPELRLRVRSDKIQAEVTTELVDAEVFGVGRLVVWPTRKRALLESEKGKSFHVHGNKGRVRFHQDPSRVEKWPELKKELGDDLSKSVVSDLFIDVKEIDFDAQKVDVLGLVATDEMNTPGSEKPALQINEALLGPIKMKGDIYGHFFVRIPGGIYYPLVIGQTARERKKCKFNTTTHEYDEKSCTYSAKMLDAEMEIGTLTDQRDTDGRRKVRFTDVFVSGEESADTFSKEDQKICRGIKHQHFHVTLGLFQASPEDKDFRIDQIDPHFHLFLNDLIQGGCFLIGEIPNP
jgi:hypothetical protein